MIGKNGTCNIPTDASIMDEIAERFRRAEEILVQFF